MTISEEGNSALADFLTQQERHWAASVAGFRSGAFEDNFMNLAEAEQRLARDRGEEVDMTEAISRASKRFPVQYAAYRRSVYAVVE